MTINEQNNYTAVDFDPFAGESIQTTAPSTESQKEVWSSVQLGDDANCAYNESVGLSFTGPLNISVLQKAIDTLIDRHESLRTLFSADGTTLLISSELKGNAIILVDLSNNDTISQKTEFDKILATEVETPFSLEKGPLFRLTLVKMSESVHNLILTAHHIICDGWSTAILLPELANLYSAIISSTNDNLPSVHRFSDYARNQHTFLNTPEFKNSEQYWLDKFNTIPTPLDLPLDHSRPAVKTFSSLREDFVIAPNIISQLKKIGSSAGCSFFVTMLAAFSAFINRLTNQDDIVIGVPAAGQSTAGDQPLVGHCVNLLPVRCVIDQEKPFVNLMRDVKNLMLDAYDNQQFTYGTMLQKLKFKRDPSRLPLVSVMFNVDQRMDESKLPFSGLTTSFFTNPRQYENFEIFVNAMESPDGLIVECQYNTDLFKAETIKRWSQIFSTLLNAITLDPSRNIGLIPVLPEQDKIQLDSWNNTNRPIEPGLGVHTLFERQAIRVPDNCAVRFNGTSLSYRELNERAEKLSNYLISKGATSESLIGVAVERSLEMVIATFAILKAGSAYVPIDPNYPSGRIAYMVDNSGLQIIISQNSVKDKLKNFNVTLICIDDESENIKNQTTIGTKSITSADSPAYVIYTSGSTGQPKGVVVPHSAVVNFLLSMQAEPGATDKDRFIAVTTLSFDIAVLELFLPLAVGGCTIISDRDTSMDAVKLISLIQNEKATVMQATPATWRLLLSSGWVGSSDLKILCGGEAFPPDLVDALLKRSKCVWNMYGPTETTVWSTCFNVIDSKQPMRIGKPIGNTQVYIANKSLSHLPIGVYGELYIGGTGVTLGYLNRNDLTQKSFINNPFGNGLLYKTGDLARFHDDGTIEYLRRVDTQVKIRGFRIELGEIEGALTSHNDIANVAVIKVEPSPGDVRLAAYIVSKNGKSLNGSELKAHLKGKLPEYMVPQHFIDIETLPTTPAGKVDRKVLAANFKSTSSSGTEYEAPKLKNELALAAIWEEVLGVSRVGLKDNFFDLGGHSLLVTQVISRIRKTIGIELNMRTFFEIPTIFEQAQYIDTVLNIRKTNESDNNNAQDREEIEI
jgi:amino acid adenylation domain-containing protein